MFKTRNIPAAEERIKALLKACKEALAVHELANQVMRSQFTSKGCMFNKRDRVWLDACFLQCFRSKKLVPQKEGPFVISNMKRPLTYILKLLVSWKIHPTFHIALLLPYHENSAHRLNYMMPPGELISRESREKEAPEWEVYAILKHKKIRKTQHYLVKWEEYPDSENTWEPEWNLKHSPDLLKIYKRRYNL